MIASAAVIDVIRWVHLRGWLHCHETTLAIRLHICGFSAPVDKRRHTRVAGDFKTHIDFRPIFRLLGLFELTSFELTWCRVGVSRGTARSDQRSAVARETEDQ
jgi:hypothetical protein